MSTREQGGLNIDRIRSTKLSGLRIPPSKYRRILPGLGFPVCGFIDKWLSGARHGMLRALGSFPLPFTSPSPSPLSFHFINLRIGSGSSDSRKQKQKQKQSGPSPVTPHGPLHRDHQLSVYRVRITSHTCTV